MSDPIGAFLFRQVATRRRVAAPVGRPAAPSARPRSAAEPRSREPALRVERRALADLEPLIEAWRGLACRAIEPNVFAEPAFAMAAARHLAEARYAEVLLVWAGPEGADTANLVGLFPLLLPSLPVLPGEARGWHSPLAASGVPLVDSARAEVVVDAVLAHLAVASAPCASVLFPMVPEDGAFAGVLGRLAEGGRPMHRFDRHERAILRHTPGAEEGIASGLGTKKLKELRRQLRRLGEVGEVRFERLRDSRGVREGVEIFLALEGSGWKRSRGTALVQDPAKAAFIRTFTRDLAREGRCRVDVLRAGQQPVAAAITVESGARAWFWKIAYDEAFARFSPGVQLTLDLSHRQLARKTLALTDSCAIAGHPMIDHLWRDRMAVADVLIATGRGASPAAFANRLRETARRRLRASAKSLYHRLRGGKVS